MKSKEVLQEFRGELKQSRGLKIALIGGSLAVAGVFAELGFNLDGAGAAVAAVGLVTMFAGSTIYSNDHLNEINEDYPQD